MSALGLSTAGLASLLPLPVTIALVGAAVAPLAARVSGRLPLITSLVALTGSSAILVAMAPTVYGGTQLTHYMGHWVPVNGSALGVAFSADAWGLTFALAATIIGGLLLLFTLSEQSDKLGPRELGAFACLFLLLDASLVGVALTGDMINLFVWFEVAALSSYGLTAFFLERPMALEAAFKVLVLTTIASFAVFIGAALIYAEHGALNFGQIHVAVAGHPTIVDLIALALLISGFATKAGLVPFHGWLPDAHTAAPGPVSALFSGLMVCLGIVAIGRLTFQVFGPPEAGPVLGLLMVLGLISALGGALFSLFQDDLKRLLAYDTISQMGVLAVGLATGNETGLAGTSYHLVNQALFKSLLFLCAGAIVHATGATHLSEMGGLRRPMPWLAAAFCIGVAAIVGVPPFNGYASVGLIHDALHHSGQTVPYLITLAAQVLTVAALGKATWMAFFRHRAGAQEHYERLRPGMFASLVGLGGACVVFGIVPSAFISHVVAPAAGGLLAGGQYSHNLLSGGGTLPSVHVVFHYFSVTELATVLATVLLAIPVARWALANSEAAAVNRLRSIQSGSVNDYATYLVVGLLISVAVLAT